MMFHVSRNVCRKLSYMKSLLWPTFPDKLDRKIFSPIGYSNRLTFAIKNVTNRITILYHLNVSPQLAMLEFAQGSYITGLGWQKRQVFTYRWRFYRAKLRRNNETLASKQRWRDNSCKNRRDPVLIPARVSQNIKSWLKTSRGFLIEKL